MRKWLLRYDDPAALAGTEYDAYLRAMWLSRRDLLGFVRAALTAPVARYACAYAVSDNATRVFDLGETVRLLGYEPRDSTERHPG